jgi:hypothetical protein
MYEITKLHEMLTKANINHTFTTMDENLYGKDAMQIRIYQDVALQKELDDVVFHRFSHGYTQGLLETYNLGECEGFETAEQVFKGWMEKFFS